MGKKNTFLFFFLMLFAIGFSQEQTMMGKVVSSSPDLEGISVQNKRTDFSTYTASGGYFNIPAVAGDTLVLSAIHLKGIQYVVKPENFSRKLVFIPMEESSMVLNEIFIDRSVNSRTLGFGESIYKTPSERSLHLATTSGGGIIPVDAVINAITGRTKMLKRAVAIDRERQKALNFVDEFSEIYFTDYLKIPKEYIEAFGFYCSKDTEVKEAIETENQGYIDLVLYDKAIEFKKTHLIVEEK